MIVLRIVALLFGVTLVWIVVSSAIRTVIVPRGEVVVLTRAVFRMVRRAFAVFARDAHTYERRDRIMARYAPTSLMLLPIVWASGVLVGFAAIYWAIDDDEWEVLLLSGSSLTTLGFQRAEHDTVMMVSVLEALIGLGLVALLITFLPTMYGQFSRREIAVSKLYNRADDRGGAATPTILLVRLHAIDGLDQLDEFWPEWEEWFAELGEAHTSFPALVHFRSPQPDRSWITGAGLVLDAAAIYLSALSVTKRPRAALMIRSGFEALRSIADFYSIPYDPDPAPDDPISVTRDEFFGVYDELAAAGIPLRPDREAAWRDFNGWRVNYDAVLIGLASLTMAPYAPWISDRSVTYPRTPLFPGRARVPRRELGSRASE
jgi:hypothetical protein